MRRASHQPLDDLKVFDKPLALRITRARSAYSQSTNLRPRLARVTVQISSGWYSNVRTDRVDPTRIANPVHIEIEFSAPHSNLHRQRVGKVFKADRQGLHLMLWLLPSGLYPLAAWFRGARLTLK